jgi:hypothetical protein
MTLLSFQWVLRLQCDALVTKVRLNYSLFSFPGLFPSPLLSPPHPPRVAHVYAVSPCSSRPLVSRSRSVLCVCSSNATRSSSKWSGASGSSCCSGGERMGASAPAGHVTVVLQ